MYIGPPPQSIPILSSDALFGIFILTASGIEAVEGTKEEAMFIARKEHRMQLGLLSQLQDSLLARVTKHNPGEVETELLSSFHSDQATFALRWATKKINLIRHHGKRMRSNPEIQKEEKPSVAVSVPVRKV